MSRVQKSNADGQPVKLHLLMSASEVKLKIQEQIEKGNSLLNTVINNREGLEEAERQKWKWHNYTTALLKTLFSTDAISKEFEWAVSGGFSRDYDLYQEIQSFKSDIKSYVSSLETALEKVDLYSLPGAVVTLSPIIKDQTKSRKVFVVHGHDEAAKQVVCRFLEALDLEPIVLHEQPNKGNTIIEKFEVNSDVGFAVVLVTPDDVGKATGEANLQKRARQNVLFEWGYFVGTLGRGRVCCLYKAGVEIPSDYTGVIYTEMDEKLGWKLGLAREIKASGITVDLNMAL